MDLICTLPWSRCVFTTFWLWRPLWYYMLQSKEYFSPTTVCSDPYLSACTSARLSFMCVHVYVFVCDLLFLPLPSGSFDNKVTRCHRPPSLPPSLALSLSPFFLLVFSPFLCSSRHRENMTDMRLKGPTNWPWRAGLACWRRKGRKEQGREEQTERSLMPLSHWNRNPFTAAKIWFAQITTQTGRSVCCFVFYSLNCIRLICYMCVLRQIKSHDLWTCICVSEMQLQLQVQRDSNYHSTPDRNVEGKNLGLDLVSLIRPVAARFAPVS